MTSMLLTLKEKPSDFTRPQKDPQEMDFFKLREYIRKARRGGKEVAKELVDLNLKFSFPLANFIIVLFGAPIATHRRLAVAMGLDPEIHPREIVAEYGKRTQSPIKPIAINKAPCQEVVISGKDVDLFSLPCPMVHDGDGGRYLGTWHLVIGQDPDSGWTNWGMYRLMVYNERLMSGLILPVSDMGKILYSKPSGGKAVHGFWRS